MNGRELASLANRAGSLPGGHRHHLSPARLFAAYRKAAVPAGGWTMEAFDGRAARALVADWRAMTRAAKAKGSRLLSRPLVRLMRGQVETVLETFARMLPSAGGAAAGGKGTQRAVNITVDAHASLWARAIEEAFARQGHAVTATVKPALQSAADDVLERATTLLHGAAPTDAARRVLTADVAEIARKVTQINDTTRARLAETIKRAVENGDPPHAVMEEVRRRMPEIATNRVPTIVRTEMGLACDRAAILGMRDEGSTVTHVSVVGCEAIEPDCPTWRGIPTCNIRNVPLQFAGSLVFHINHTGTIVPSGFLHRDGQPPKLDPKPGEGIGTWEDRGRPVPALVSDGGPPPPKPRPPPQPPAAPAAPPSAPVQPAAPPPAQPHAPVLPAPAQPHPAVLPAPEAPHPQALPHEVPGVHPPVVPPAPEPQPPAPATLLPDVPELADINAMVERAGWDEGWFAEIREYGDLTLNRMRKRFNDQFPERADMARDFKLLKDGKEDAATLLPKDEFVAQSEHAHPVGVFDRGLRADDPLGNLTSGEFFWGRGIYGDGIYAKMAQADDGLTVENLVSGRHSGTAKSYAGDYHDSKIVTGFLRGDAKVVKYRDLSGMQSEARNRLYKLSDRTDDAARAMNGGTLPYKTLDEKDEWWKNEANRAAFDEMAQAADVVSTFISDLGVFARLSGYDAIHVTSDEYVVVVNRAKAVFLDTAHVRNATLPGGWGPP